ncbi:hypothetical protein H0H93_012129 [Arthromyces matolae]|nr:hypothetical protein H0H93_012129 [Arthromyces matolae]
MFARLSAIVLLALPMFAMAGGCNTEGQQCCNSVQSSKSTAVAAILHSLIGVAAEDITVPVGRKPDFFPGSAANANSLPTA